MNEDISLLGEKSTFRLLHCLGLVPILPTGSNLMPFIMIELLEMHNFFLFLMAR